MPVSINSCVSKIVISDSLYPSHFAKQGFLYCVSPAQTGLYSSVHTQSTSLLQYKSEKETNTRISAFKRLVLHVNISEELRETLMESAVGTFLL